MNPASSQYQSPTERRDYPAGRTPAMQPSQDVLEYLREYAQQKPEVAALWCFGIGFILGWKLKPW